MNLCAFTAGGNHRETNWTSVWYKDTAANDGWEINGVEMCIARLENKTGFWGIPSFPEDEFGCEDIGPFETLEAAAVALTLLQS